jgi:hypothetical protein
MMRIFTITLIAVFSIFFSFGVSNASSSGITTDDENCMMCHKYPGLTRVNDEGYLRLFYVDSEKYDHSVHTKVKCSGCHADIKEIPHKEAKKVDCTTECHIKNAGSEKPFSHKKIALDLESSIHNPENTNVRAKIEEDFPTCTDCHNNPTYRFIDNDVEDIYGGRHKERVLQKCAVCHDNATDYAYFFNHVTHRIKDLAPSEDVVKTCSKCHAKEEMAQKHKLKNAAATYLDTFHGKAVEFGFENAPTCISCHVKTGESAHKIMSYKNPQSATFEANRYLACKDADCHANPGQEFGMIRMHTVIDSSLYPIEFYVALGFTVLTIGAFYPLLILMILELIRELFPNVSFRRKKRKD